MFNINKKESSGIKNWHLIILFLIIFVSIFLKIYSYYWPKMTISFKEKELTVLLADTEKHLYKGLGGKTNFGNYNGMLFVFKNEGQHTMIMRDMHFSIDVVWLKSLSSEKKCYLNRFNIRKLITGNYSSCSAEVVDFVSDLPVELNKSESELTKYFHRDSSTMVLELPSGWVKNNDLKIGDTLFVLD